MELADVLVKVPEIGDVTVSVVYGGMWYCIVDAESVNIELIPSNGKTICRVGEMIKVACREQYPVKVCSLISLKRSNFIAAPICVTILKPIIAPRN